MSTLFKSRFPFKLMKGVKIVHLISAAACHTSGKKKLLVLYWYLTKYCVLCSHLKFVKFDLNISHLITGLYWIILTPLPIQRYVHVKLNFLSLTAGLACWLPSSGTWWQLYNHQNKHKNVSYRLAINIKLDEVLWINYASHDQWDSWIMAVSLLLLGSW